ncbi:unnamed protein product, partial [Hapterophycus canaliculatus]
MKCAAARKPQHCQNLHLQPPVEDLTELLDVAWNEEIVLHNCRMRFLSRKPYTAAGSLMIAVNPCRSVSELYDRDMQLKYFQYNRTDLPAHAYTISAEAYWALCEGPQTIMLAGECGSGKSFTASVLLEHLVGAASMCRSGKYGVHQSWRLKRLVACRRTILESFGSAATPLNTSSSRFTAHTKVLFSKDASRVLGVEGQTILLETSRLCGPLELQRERVFHIFYQVR